MQEVGNCDQFPYARSYLIDIYMMINMQTLNSALPEILTRIPQIANIATIFSHPHF